MNILTSYDPGFPSGKLYVFFRLPKDFSVEDRAVFVQAFSHVQVLSAGFSLKML